MAYEGKLSRMPRGFAGPAIKRSEGKDLKLTPPGFRDLSVSLRNRLKRSGGTDGALAIGSDGFFDELEFLAFKN
jgi:hypothetical protein